MAASGGTLPSEIGELDAARLDAAMARHALASMVLDRAREEAQAAAAKRDAVAAEVRARYQIVDGDSLDLESRRIVRGVVR